MNEKESNYRMIDIDLKQDTHRRAVASGFFYASEDTISKVKNKQVPKGDVLALAEIAGIQGAKQTSQLLPLCHPLALTSVKVWSEIKVDSIQVYCEAKTISKTGVEMEALCGVNSALLCIYDLVKAIDPVLKIGNIQLEVKEGGKSGVWNNPNLTNNRTEEKKQENALKNIHFSIITMSDRCFENKAEDLSGKYIQEWISRNQSKLIQSKILPDFKEKLVTEVKSVLSQKSTQCILITGGTGVSPRDITPEAMNDLIVELSGKEISGVGEVLRSQGYQKTKYAVLSRSSAYLIENTLIITLPGSLKAVKEGLEVVADLIPHLVHISSGGTH